MKYYITDFLKWLISFIDDIGLFWYYVPNSDEESISMYLTVSEGEVGEKLPGPRHVNLTWSLWFWRLKPLS